MSGKPDDVPEEVWQQALSLFWENADAQAAIAYAILQARSQAFEEVATLIEEGFEKVVGEPYRDDGKPSKNDKCPHDRYMYEDCESCCVDAIRQHSQKGENE